jgi:EAL domain-containing protein (putative c-di-GMP-specific phosphodiesterase class I)
MSVVAPSVNAYKAVGYCRQRAERWTCTNVTSSEPDERIAGMAAQPPELRTRLANATPIVLAIVFCAAGLATFTLPDRVNVVALPMVQLGQIPVALLARARRPLNASAARVRNAFLLCMVTCVPAQFFTGYGRLHSDNGSLRLGFVAVAISLLLNVYGSGCVASPFFRVPALANWVGVILAAMALGTIGVALQWAPSGRVEPSTIKLLRVIAALGAGLAVVAAYPLLHGTRAFHRTNESWYVTAAGAYIVGQLVVLLGMDSPGTATNGPSALGLGIVAASMWAPNASKLGGPLPQLRGRSEAKTAPIVMVTVMSVSVALIVPLNAGWGSAVGLGASAVAILQSAGLAWFISSHRSHATNQTSPTTLSSSISLHRELRAALVNGEIVAHYQEIRRANDHAVAGYECLARWNHPRRGLLTAAEFFEAAERDDLIDAIDRLMLTTTLDHLDELLASTQVDEPFVTVNVNPKRFAGLELLAEVRTELGRRDRDGSGLVVELTEHASIVDWPQFSANVTGLQELGVGVAVDDFGMGSANYALLLQCDPDFVKLDKMITMSSISSARGRAIVRSALAAAEAVGARVVIEGVEDISVTADLLALGAHFFQGYAFGKAEPFVSLGI